MNMKFFNTILLNLVFLSTVNSSDLFHDGDKIPSLERKKRMITYFDSVKKELSERVNLESLPGTKPITKPIPIKKD